MDNSQVEFRYECCRLTLWILSICGTIILFLAGVMVFFKTKSIIGIIFASFFFIVSLIQVTDLLKRKFPYVEVGKNYLEWGKVRSSKTTIEFMNISLMILNYGTDEDNIMIIDKSGREYEIHRMFYFSKISEMEKILQHKSREFGFKVQSGKRK